MNWLFWAVPAAVIFLGVAVALIRWWRQRSDRLAWNSPCVTAFYSGPTRKRKRRLH